MVGHDPTRHDTRLEEFVVSHAANFLFWNCRVIDASMELNYIYVLAGVAYLWRPHANAKDYACK
jgi:hypothetical protein